MATKAQRRLYLRGGRYRETGMMLIDRRAKAEGDAIKLLNKLRPQHTTTIPDSILWNKNRYRLDVRHGDERTAQDKQLRRYMAGFFVAYKSSIDRVLRVAETGR